MNVTASSKKNKYCSFCKHWYDPTNSALNPMPGKDLYKIDSSISKKCVKRNLIMPALSICKFYESKM